MSTATKLQNLRTVKAKLKSILHSWSSDFSSDVLSKYPDAVNAVAMFNSGEQEYKDFVFVDFRGVVLFQYSKDEIDALTELPTADDLPYWEVPLTFQGWNYTLAELQATNHAVVGAHYVPTDGNIHLFVKRTSRMKDVHAYQRFYFQTDGATITWYDGEGSQVSQRSYSTNGYEQYNVTADVKYHIVIEVTGTTFAFGNSTVYLGGSVYWNKGILSVYGTDDLSFNATTNYLFSYIRGYVSLSRNMTNSMTIAHTYMFSYSSIPAIVVPRCVTKLGTQSNNNAFETRWIALPPTITEGQFLFANCSVRYAVIPEGVTTIGDFAVYNDHFLNKLVLPSTLTSVGSYGIATLGSLMDLYCYATIPPTLASAIPTISNNDYKIHVPSGSLSAYQSATNWSGASSYMIEDL